MPLIAFDVSETRDYIVEQERKELERYPSYEPTVFELGVLDPHLSSHLFDQSMSFSLNAKGPDAPADVQVHQHQRDIEIVRFGVKGWKRLTDKAGAEVKPDFDSFPIGKGKPRRGLTDRAIAYIKPWINELAKQIERDNLITGDVEKNSAAPSLES